MKKLRFLKSGWFWIIVLVVTFIVSIGGPVLTAYLEEQRRQDLIHMGDRIDKAFEDYQDILEEQKLIDEYDILMTSITENRVPAEDLRDSIERACSIELQLMELYPTAFTKPSTICD